MNEFSNQRVRTPRRIALALAGTTLLLGGLVATPAGAGQHQPHSGSSSGSSASSRSGSSSSTASSSSSRSSSSSSRRAVPRSSSGSSRSAGRTPSHSGHGSRSHHGGYYGDHYGGYYYGSYGHYPPLYPSFGYYWWNSLYSPWWAYSVPRVYVSSYPDRSSDAVGAIDTDIAPENAEVYIDGELVGTADDYDGWPSYLWLENGTYDVVFYHPGYQTMARQIIVRAGVVTDVEDEMQRGEAVRPEDLGPQSHERRDARLAEEAEKQAAVEAREAAGEPAWRERIRTERRSRRQEPATMANEGDRDLRSEPGRVTLSIEPSDAAIYLDGRFLGAADRLSRADGPLLVDAGDHDLEVVRPGYATRKQSFSVKPGESVELDLSLDRQ